VGTILKDDEEVSSVYANLMLVSVAFAISLSPIIGMFTDRVSPKVTLPVSFLLRAFAIFLFYFINDPTSFYAYAVGSLLVLGTTAEQICSDSILMRNAEREIRGVIYGTGVAMGYLGQLILCIIGGWLFDHVSVKGPFIFIGVLDLIFAIVVIILGAKGIIKNDITERKQ
jgi:MFS family permease